MPYSAITHDSRHPFETLILIAGVIAGGAAVFGGLWPSSIAAAFPLWVQCVWGLFLGGGALVALVGIILKFRDIGIFLEQVGLVAFATACFTYSAALAVYNWRGGFAIAFLLLFLGIASVWQWARLEKFIRSHIKAGARVRMRRDSAR